MSPSGAGPARPPDRESFDWLLGNERWQARVAEAKAEGRTDVPDRSGLEEIFEEISPIEDFGGSMSLSFRDHRFEEMKYSIDDCKSATRPTPRPCSSPPSS